MPNRSSHRRTTSTGPPIASAVHTTATTANQTTRDSNPNRRDDATFATSPIAQNSTAVQPTSCTTFSADGRNDPRSPSTGRSSTIVGTPSRWPASATSASGMHPISVPTAIARKARPSPSAGTSRAPVTITSSPTDRSNHSTARSRPPRSRRSGGTGRMPQAGDSRCRICSRRSATRATFAPSAGVSRIRFQGSPAAVRSLLEPESASQPGSPDSPALRPDATRPLGCARDHARGSRSSARGAARRARGPVRRARRRGVRPQGDDRRRRVVGQGPRARTSAPGRSSRSGRSTGSAAASGPRSRGSTRSGPAIR